MGLNNASLIVFCSTSVIHKQYLTFVEHSVRTKIKIYKNVFMVFFYRLFLYYLHFLTYLPLLMLFYSSKCSTYSKINYNLFSFYRALTRKRNIISLFVVITTVSSICDAIRTRVRNFYILFYFRSQKRLKCAKLGLCSRL